MGTYIHVPLTLEEEEDIDEIVNGPSLEDEIDGVDKASDNSGNYLPMFQMQMAVQLSGFKGRERRGLHQHVRERRLLRICSDIKEDRGDGSGVYHKPGKYLRAWRIIKKNGG